jgi:hypothetical protein
MSNENPNENPKTIKELEKVVEEITKTGEAVDIDINEMLEKFRSRTELEKVIEEKCVRVITTVICEGDVVGVNSGRYWVEGVVNRVSRYGIAIMNPSKEFLVRLGKINVVVIHKRGKIYEKYKDTIDKFFKSI